MATYAYLKRTATDTGPDFSADDVFGELAEHLLDYGDLNWALDKLLREGVTSPETGKRVKGLNQILKDIENKLREYFRNYDVDPAREELDEMLNEMVRKALDDLDRRQRQSPGGGEGSKERREIEDRWKQLAQSPAQFIKEMGSDSDLTQGSPEDAGWLQDRQEQIRNFEEFYDDYSYRFRGRQPLSLQEAMDLVDEIRKLEEMERNLRKGSLDRVDQQAVDHVAGEDTMKGLSSLKEIRKMLTESGHLVEEGYYLRLTPMAIRKIAQKALRDIFYGLKLSQLGRHPVRGFGQGLELQEDLKDYQYGDAFHVNLTETLKRSLVSGELKRGRIGPKDYVVHKMEKLNKFSTALLIDMSWSMAWGGKFTAAKKVALALEHLIRTQFPTDRLHLVGFFTYAIQIKSKELPFANLNHIEPFTNMQDALRLASRLLEKDGNANKQIIMVTDGQPTAYVREDGMHIEWPYLGLSPNAFFYTLEEVKKMTKKNIVLNVFMIDENPALRSFVEEMVKINHGRGLFTRPDQLGRYIIVDYIKQRSRFVN
ncbi:MAG: VWA domain-containing protein [Nitrospirae bacterium]|nr:VWA domain-containing protein [Nitrospirota bacterium]